MADPTPRVAIVGAGATGLACAAALPAGVDAVLVDRVPVAGGVLGWQHPDAVRLEAAARAARVRLLLGATATRWDGGELVVIGPAGVERIRVAALVLASGARPLGRAELALTGPRPAGVLVAPAACHLIETGLVVGRSPVVVGGGDWALRSVERLLSAGVERIDVVAPDGLLRPFPDVERVVVHAAGRPLAVEGGERVSALRVELDDGLHVSLACDALILAHGLTALRNVDGAVREGARVVAAQPLDDPGSVAAAEAAGRVAAAACIRLLEGGRA